MRLQPPATLLSGPAGSGKTSSIATMVKAGIETFVVITEPDGAASLIDACDRIGAPIDKLHWREALPNSEGWDQLENMITSVNSMDQKMLSEQRDMGKSSFRPAALYFLKSFQNFRCDRTGLDYGDVSKWGADRCLAVDSLSGWCLIGWGATVGYKPTANPGEWGIAQNFVFSMLRKVLSDRQCYFILTSHIEKEMDEMSGIKKIMVSAIGAKLAPKIPPLFSEVVMTSKLPTGTFNWSTLDTGMDLKNRALPNSAKIIPDFALIVEAYKRRLTLAGQQTAPVEPTHMIFKGPSIQPQIAPMTSIKSS